MFAGVFAQPLSVPIRGNNRQIKRAGSSVGRAPRSQRGGRGFESPPVHYIELSVCYGQWIGGVDFDFVYIRSPDPRGC